MKEEFPKSETELKNSTLVHKIGRHEPLEEDVREVLDRGVPTSRIKTSKPSTPEKSQEEIIKEAEEKIQTAMALIADAKRLLEEADKMNGENSTKYLVEQPGPDEVPDLNNMHKMVSPETRRKEEMARTTDPLMKILNRNGFGEALEKAKEIAKRERMGNENAHEYALMLLDIDKFKHVNDTFGHIVGDDILRLASEYLQKSFRPDDTLCRYGGEEIVILLKDVDKKQFLSRVNKRKSSDGSKDVSTLGFPIKILQEFKDGEKVYRVIHSEEIPNTAKTVEEFIDEDGSIKYKVPESSEVKNSFPYPNDTVIIEKTVTFSGGLVPFDPVESDSKKALKTADSILYAMKTAGRNAIGTSEDIASGF